MTEIIEFIQQNPAAVIAGLMGLTCQLVWPVFKDRRNILTVQLGIGAFHAIQYALLDAFSGAGIAALGATQTFVALIAGDRPSLKKLGFVFLPLIAVVCYVTWSGFPSLLAFSACSLIMIGRLQEDTLAMRIFLLAAVPFGMGYDIAVDALPALIGSIASATIAIRMLIREVHDRHLLDSIKPNDWRKLASRAH